MVAFMIKSTISYIQCLDTMLQNLVTAFEIYP